MGANKTPQAIANDLIDLLNDKGQGDYIGEPISQLAHSLQAAHLARSSNAADETVVAALLHDIGQFLPASEVRRLAGEVKSMKSRDSTSSDTVGRVGHEMIGQRYLLSLGLSDKVAMLVRSHVEAKRYLCATDSAYYDTLSDASKKSLMFQGGPMAGTELAEWAANPLCDEMCQMRKWDDGAKVVGLEVAPAEAYRALVESCVRR